MAGVAELKVGELARASGLSIRTVRYYDQIGLLTPSRRSASGHRVYDDADVRRLYRICLLRRVGLLWPRSPKLSTTRTGTCTTRFRRTWTCSTSSSASGRRFGDGCRT